MAIYSGFTHQKWWFSIVMLNYQRVHLTQKLQQPHYPPYAVLNVKSHCHEQHLSPALPESLTPSTETFTWVVVPMMVPPIGLLGCGARVFVVTVVSVVATVFTVASHLRAPWFADKPTVSCGKSRQIMVNPIVNLHVGWFIHVYTTHVWKMCLNHAPFTSICTVTYHLVDVWTIQKSNDFLLCWPHWH